MSKHEKEIGLPKPAEVRRADPPVPSHAKAKRKRRVFPPHWEVRTYGFVNNQARCHLTPHRYQLKGWGYSIFPHDFQGGLIERLAYLATLFPQTVDWPVRFVCGGEQECSREVIR